MAEVLSERVNVLHAITGFEKCVFFIFQPHAIHWCAYYSGITPVGTMLQVKY